jgi:hypothetical protein
MVTKSSRKEALDKQLGLTLITDGLSGCQRAVEGRDQNKKLTDSEGMEVNRLQM